MVKYPNALQYEDRYVCFSITIVSRLAFHGTADGSDESTRFTKLSCETRALRVVIVH